MKTILFLLAAMILTACAPGAGGDSITLTEWNLTSTTCGMPKTKLIFRDNYPFQADSQGIFGFEQDMVDTRCVSSGSGNFYLNGTSLTTNMNYGTGPLCRRESIDWHPPYNANIQPTTLTLSNAGCTNVFTKGRTGPR